MKIYPNNKKVYDKVLLDENDIPLSYLSNVFSYADTIIKFDEELLKLNKKNSINLFQKVNKTYLFFKDNYTIAKENQDYIIDKDGKINLLNTSKKASYRPTIFGYKYVLQREIPFSSSRMYNINIDFTGMEKVKELLKTVSIPNNIKLNDYHGDSPDIKFFDGEAKYFTAMKNGGYNDNCNIYLIKSNLSNKIIYNKQKIFDVAKPNIFTQTEFVVEPSWDIFNHESEMDLFPKVTYDYIKLTINHSPILIMRDRLNYKLVVLCGKEIFTEPRLIKFLIENIVYAYSIGYYKVPEKTDAYLNTFISSNNIDYYYSLNNKMNAHHPKINFKDAVDKSSFNSYEPYKLIDVFTTNTNVYYDYVDSSNNVYFKKLNNDEPQKDNNESLIYTVDQELKFINNVDYSLFEIEQSPLISYDYKDNQLTLTVSPYYSSKNYIACDKESKIIINDINKNYSLYLTKTTVFKDQKFYILEKDNPSSDIKIADIIIKLENNITPTDVRIKGGGSIKFDNYDYMDTGNIAGRPYRVGTSMVITLPKKYEPYRDQLQEQIDKHISSSEAAVLIFKD